MIEVLQKGLLLLPVCARRHGLERFGVPQGGPMDRLSCLIANRLVGNEDDSAALEIFLTMPTLRFCSRRVFVLTGGEGAAVLERGGARLPVPWNETVLAEAGDVLTGGLLARGLRAYLAVSGGLAGVPLRPAPLQPGDCLPLGAPRSVCPVRCRRPSGSLPGEEAVLHVTPGVHAGHFSPEGLQAFYGSAYTYTPQSDRMGIRLEGPRIAFREGFDGNIISEGMLPGDIQVTSAGLPILMMADCQTVGGYSKIAHLSYHDLPLAAQLRPGSKLRFVCESSPAGTLP